MAEFLIFVLVVNGCLVQMAFRQLHKDLEVDRTADFFFPAARLPLLSLAWLAVGAVFLKQYGVGGDRTALALADGVSIVWALFAMAIVLAGIARNVEPLRWAGLVLFAIVSVKVFLHDVASLDTFWRIVAFLILGVVLVAGSFVYLKFREKFTVSPREDAAP